jgi:hypothetical protein
MTIKKEVLVGEMDFKKRCRILPAGDLGVSPNFVKSPKVWGTFRGFGLNVITRLNRMI